MGEFLTVSAVRADDMDAVAGAVRRFFEKCSWPVTPVEELGPGVESVAEEDVQLFAAVDGWTVVYWPEYFTEIAAAEFISGDLGTVVTSVSIHDGDYWRHALSQNGAVLDQFAGIPDYFTDDPDEATRLRAKYAGRPDLVAEVIGCPVDQVAPYLVVVDTDEEMGKAFEDDEAELDDPWVFVDFWRRLGVPYPDDLAAPAARLRLAENYFDKIPAGDAEL